MRKNRPDHSLQSSEPHRDGIQREALVALIERLEKAEGPSRELDAHIGWHVGGWRGHICPTPESVYDGVRKNKLPVSGYTGSIDAALTLVPEGWAWALHHHRDCSGSNADPIAKVSRVNWGEKENEAKFYKSADGRGATPAIALCIAALKARLSTMKVKEGRHGASENTAGTGPDSPSPAQE